MIDITTSKIISALNELKSSVPFEVNTINRMKSRINILFYKFYKIEPFQNTKHMILIFLTRKSWHTVFPSTGCFVHFVLFYDYILKNIAKAHSNKQCCFLVNFYQYVVGTRYGNDYCQFYLIG